ncbi:hypothetical protein QWY86_15615 [Pedobacter aquatilis]|uniref:hypothetical protein n=1 Tax=Pedobacter aquatilis TaxID=351343 RepID=UPI0025B5FF65|nr:hypothetical protein [Pedobacter aquatilis]MDN3588111.1 hypothetical protein [Pedobacter aquatilis]
MKRKLIYFLGIAMAFGSESFGQNKIESTGNVGIGTSEPLNALDVRGGNILVKNLDNITNESAVMIDHSLKFSPYQNFGTSLRTFTENAGNNTYALQFFTQNSYQTGQTEKLRIKGNGDVGIGTTNPRGLFDVATPLDGYKLGAILGRLNEGNHQGEGTFLGVRGYTTSLSMGSKSFALEHGFYGIVNSSINFFRGQSADGGEISFNTDKNIERVRINKDGNMGIGTSNPQEKLSVNGNVRAREVKIEANNWPDYVFEDNYQVSNLKELERFVKTNKHLPDIPAAKVIEKSGVEIGDFIKRLLKSHEELTLHVIKQNKRIEQLESLVKRNK